MSNVTRREALWWLSLAPIAAVVAARRAAEQVAAGIPYTPKFFTEQEWRTVRILADDVIPRDDRSGSATEAGVPEFMDFMMIDRPQDQPQMRDGLRWLDARSQKRFNATFADCSNARRAAILDDIAWPASASRDLADGVAFFTMFRNLTASGFWSSQMGVADLQYIGNTVVPEWKGCPPAALEKLGVSY